MESNLCLVEAGTTYSKQSPGYVMDDPKFESREKQEITSLLINMPISSGCTQTGSQTFWLLFPKEHGGRNVRPTTHLHLVGILK